MICDTRANNKENQGGYKETKKQKNSLNINAINVER